MNHSNQNNEQQILDYFNSGRITAGTVPNAGTICRLVWVDPGSAREIKNMHFVDDIRGKRVIVLRFETEKDSYLNGCKVQFRHNGHLIEAILKQCKVQPCGNKAESLGIELD